MAEQRLQKILSQVGIASRRHAEEMIQTGQVTVNGEIVTTLGSKADLDHDTIRVNGRLLKPPKRLIYIALNKPKGCVTTVSDPEGRPTVMDLLRGIKERVFPIGRLDYASEGLLLFTNDGEFAHRLTAPASHVVKMYQVKANGPLTEEQEEAFRAGVPLHGQRTAPAEIQRVRHGANPWYEVQIAEGRQNQIRMMFRHFGRLVEKLRRTRIGFLELDLAPGRYRLLTDREVGMFRKILELDGEGARPEPVAQASEIEEFAQESVEEPKKGFAKPAGIQSAAGFRPVRPTVRKGPPKGPGSRPGSRSASNRPGSDRRGSDRPGSTRPGAKRPGSTRPESTRPGSTRSGSTRSGSTRPGSTRPGGKSFDGAGSKGPAKRTSGKPPFGKSSASKDSRSGGPRSGPGAGGPRTAGPGAGSRTGPRSGPGGRRYGNGSRARGNQAAIGQAASIQAGRAKTHGSQTRRSKAAGRETSRWTSRWGPWWTSRRRSRWASWWRPWRPSAWQTIAIDAER